MEPIIVVGFFAVAAFAAMLVVTLLQARRERKRDLTAQQIDPAIRPVIARAHSLRHTYEYPAPPLSSSRRDASLTVIQSSGPTFLDGVIVSELLAPVSTQGTTGDGGAPAFQGFGGGDSGGAGASDSYSSCDSSSFDSSSSADSGTCDSGSGVGA